MALTEFGKTVRIARLNTDQTLLSMSEALGTTPAFLSAMETGRKKIPKKWIGEISNFFMIRDYIIAELSELADVSNGFVELDGLGLQQKMLVARLARSPLTPEQLKKITEILR